MIVTRNKKFTNGQVYAAKLDDGYPIEFTDTFLPSYTVDCINENTNKLRSNDVGSRAERWMVGVSVMSGCPIGCKFCATGQLKKWRNLTWQEIVEQVSYVLDNNPNYDPNSSFEFKINYTRMGEPMLNLDNVRRAIEEVDNTIPRCHHYVSTIGIRGMDTSWIKRNITLQLSLHSLNDERRRNLIPFSKTLSIEELGQVRTRSYRKTTVNLTLVDTADFDINKLRKYFDPQEFFIKLSPINQNIISEANRLGAGIISVVNPI